MGIRDQRVDIGPGIQTIRRAVFDYRSLPKWRIQTGYVNYDNAYVPVWRVYDPEDHDLHAVWKEGIWKNIYRLDMPRDLKATTVRYQTLDYRMGDGESIALPLVSAKLSYELERHLQCLGEL